MKIGIVVVAYNAEPTLVQTLDRIPADFRQRVEEIIICDDASHDGTFELGRGWAAQPGAPTTHIIRHMKNLGYGGNQKAAYSFAIERGLDMVILLHADGQYAPEVLPDFVEAFERTTCDAVFGSRMMEKGAALRGGMPLYKFLGNKVLSRFENWVLGSKLTEFHSGYRAYRVDALKRVPFMANSNGFDFDTQIIAQLLGVDARIVEIPIPTYYGDEICYVNGLRYAWDVVRDVVEYRLASTGFGTPAWVRRPEYSFKEEEGSSHKVILNMARTAPRSRLLDLGCAGGLLAERLHQAGHYVVGVDYREVGQAHRYVDQFIEADLAKGLPEALVGESFNIVIAADVLEHLPEPQDLLRQITAVLQPGGHVIVSVPNFSHWYPRLRIALGLFGYDRLGILDQSHLRFFTRRSLARLVREAGFDIVEQRTTSVPFTALMGLSRYAVVAQKVGSWLARAWPSLFAYQYVLRLTPHRGDTVHISNGHVPALAPSTSLTNVQ